MPINYRHLFMVRTWFRHSCPALLLAACIKMIPGVRANGLSVSILVSVLACADSSDGFVLLPSLLAETDVQTTTTPEMPRLDLVSMSSQSQQKIGDLETWVMSMAGKSAMDNATLGFIDQIRQMVEDMVPQVLSRSEASVQELKRLLEAFSHCRLESAQTDFSDLQQRHLYCRRNESLQALATTEAKQVWFASDLVRQSECAKFVSIDQIPSHDECGVPQHADTMRYYAEALRNKFKDKYDEWVRKKDGCDTAANSTESLRQKKAALEEQQQELRALCNSLQDELDHRVCGASVAAQRHCRSYEECYDRARVSFLEQNKTVAALEKEMQQEYRALKRIICILKAFEGGVEEKELEVCRLRTVNLDPLGIDWASFRIPPLRINCSTRQSWPNASSPEYALDVYGSVPTDVALKECSAVPCCQAVYS
ncbi:unnamed protein product [Symbiodinium pilosum]|uniref:Uncharacterized protein n=1 Tax=Symbiodinium pilosum TaxID=2952 RepID=A0A812T817_SYMPI|nr:unnamed protein product [Symbiodinium pilosum]